MTMNKTIGLITASALCVLASACGADSRDPQTADRSQDLAGAEDGNQPGAEKNGSAAVGSGTTDDPGNAGGSVSSGAAGDVADPDTSVSDEPGSTPGSPGGGVAPVAPSCVPEFDPSTSSGDSPCNFVAGGECFVAGADACACAGCAEDRCVILESYPAQARCQ
jgi:hypothetical protein